MEKSARIASLAFAMTEKEGYGLVDCQSEKNYILARLCKKRVRPYLINIVCVRHYKPYFHVIASRKAWQSTK